MHTPPPKQTTKKMKIGLLVSTSWPNSATLRSLKGKEKIPAMKALVGQLNSTRYFLFGYKNEGRVRLKESF